MSVFNKAKLTNLRKRIEKEYDLEQCPFAQRILDTIAECYDECCDDRDAELRKEKAEYLGEYRQQDVVCECGKEMLLANIYEHHKFACPLRHRPKKPTYEKCSVSRRDLHCYTRNMEWIEEYGENKKKPKENLTEDRLFEWWDDLKELATKMGRPVGVFKKRMKTQYDIDLP
jgi:hypothetical protein